jgi:hypothetical protein
MGMKDKHYQALRGGLVFVAEPAPAGAGFLEDGA